PAQTITGHSGPINSLNYSANSQMLASAGSDHTLRFWNAADGKPIATVVAHSGPVTAAALHPNNTQAFSMGDDGLLKWWQLPIAPSRALPAHADAVTQIVESANGAQVLSAGADKVVRLSDFGNGQPLRQFTGSAAAVNGAALSPNGNLVAGGAADGRLFLW